MMSRRFIGGLYGRAIGRLLIHVYGGVPTDQFWMWMDPGAMALIGAASFFAGVSRLTMSLTVIMVRTISVVISTLRKEHTFRVILLENREQCKFLLLLYLIILKMSSSVHQYYVQLLQTSSVFLCSFSKFYGSVLHIVKADGYPSQC